MQSFSASAERDLGRRHIEPSRATEYCACLPIDRREAGKNGRHVPRQRWRTPNCRPIALPSVPVVTINTRVAPPIPSPGADEMDVSLILAALGCKIFGPLGDSWERRGGGAGA